MAPRWAPNDPQIAKPAATCYSCQQYKVKKCQAFSGVPLGINGVEDDHYEALPFSARFAARLINIVRIDNSISLITCENSLTIGLTFGRVRK